MSGSLPELCDRWGDRSAATIFPGRSLCRHETFVGRSGQLAGVLDVAAKVAAGEPWLIFVEGEPGVGRTAFLRRAVTRLDKFTAMTATADPHEIDFPGAVLEQLLNRVDPVKRRLFPLLVSDFRKATPFAVGAQLIGLLGALDTRQPVILAVDDAHLIDDLSLGTLLFVQRRLWRDRVMLILTVPSGGQDGQRSRLRSFDRDHERVLRLRLEGLNRREITDFADSMLGGRPLEEQVVDQLWARTGGLPRYLRLLLSEVPAERIARGDVGLTSPSLEAAILDAQAAAPADSRALANALAVLDARVPLHVAAGLAELTGIGATRALTPLLQAGLVEWWPHEAATPVAIRHPVQRDAIYARLSPACRQRLHGRAADVVSGTDMWAHRVAAAGAPDPGLADQLQSCAADESDRGLHALAATHLRWAADLSPTRTERERRLIRAFFSLQLGDQTRRMLDLRQDLEACTPGILRDIALASVSAHSGEEAALELAQRAWRAALGHPNPAVLAKYVSYTLPAIFLVGGVPRTAAEVCRWVLAAGEPDTGALGTERRSGTRGVLGWAALVLAGPRAALHAIAETADDPNEIRPANAQLIAVRGSLEVLDGRLTDGLADLHLAGRYALEGRPVTVGRRLSAFIRWADFLAGRWEEQTPADEMAAGASATWYDLPYEQLSRVWVLAARGDWNDAQRWVDLTEEASRTLPGSGEHLCGAIARAVLAQARGDHNAMYQAVLPLRDSSTTSYDHVQTCRWWLPLLAEGEIGTDRLDAAEETLSRLGDVHDVPYLYLQVARLRAWMANLRGDVAAALAIYEDAATSPVTRDDAVFYRSVLLLNYGRLLRTGGKRRRAAVHLQAAHAVFARLEATPLRRQCMDELARCGLHAPRQRTMFTTRLTAREREIARLVATGRTNREISAELIVTQKTVEYHLGNVYLKLNVSGRRELRDLVQQKALTA